MNPLDTTEQLVVRKALRFSGQMFKPRQIRSRFCSHKCSGRYHSRKQYVKLREQDLDLMEGI